MKPLLRLLATTAMVTAAAAAEPSVKGTLTANGTTTKLTHVVAYEIDSTTEKGYMDIRVVISDRALSREVALSDEKLQELMTAKKVAALRVLLNPDCKVLSAAPYSPAMRNYVSSGAFIQWKPSAYDDEKVAGRFWTDGEKQLAGEKWSFDITFSAPIVLDPEAKTVEKK
jgi:hypothetical protein